MNYATEIPGRTVAEGSMLDGLQRNTNNLERLNHCLRDIERQLFQPRPETANKEAQRQRDIVEACVYEQTGLIEQAIEKAEDILNRLR